MRAFRYFLAGFETLVALFFFCLFAGGLVATVQLSIPTNPPLEGAKRAVVLAELSRAMVVAVMGGILAFWMGRCALRNFRDAKVKASAVEQRR